MKPTHNRTLAIGGVSSPLDSFEVAEGSVLRKNFCAENPAHRKSANRKTLAFIVNGKATAIFL